LYTHELIASSNQYNGDKIHNIEATERLHKILKQSKNYYASEYLGDKYESGEIIDGITHENFI
jgi:competence transcription factor ComK